MQRDDISISTKSFYFITGLTSINLSIIYLTRDQPPGINDDAVTLAILWSEWNSLTKILLSHSTWDVNLYNAR